MERLTLIDVLSEAIVAHLGLVVLWYDPIDAEEVVSNFSAEEVIGINLQDTVMSGYYNNHTSWAGIPYTQIMGIVLNGVSYFAHHHGSIHLYRF